jgi:hypothetical protein
MTSNKSHDVNNEGGIFQGFGGGLVETEPLTAGEGVAYCTTSKPGRMRASDRNLW